MKNSLGINQDFLTSNKKILDARLLDESELIMKITDEASIDVEDGEKIKQYATEIVEYARENYKKYGSPAEKLLYEYKLTTSEGMVLMALSESLLRIPDSHNFDAILEDKIPEGNYGSHIGVSHNTLINAAGIGLSALKIVLAKSDNNAATVLKKLVKSVGMPTIRLIVRKVILHMGNHFVYAHNIKEAIKLRNQNKSLRYCNSYDMLGEAAQTEQDAQEYHNKYVEACIAVGCHQKQHTLLDSDGISVKLTSLHPKYEIANHREAADGIYNRLKEISLIAKQYNISLFIDAEESYRLFMSLEILERLCSDDDLKGWDGIGFVVQAYAKTGIFVVEWLGEMAKRLNRKILVRLVKGAYWDYEIKHAQELGLDEYPVFTRKSHTDISYICCAKKMLAARDMIHCCFATHNSHTIASILHFCNGDYSSMEFQKLHGMSDAIYGKVLEDIPSVKCRVYAPVGDFSDLLPYLARRLIENNANSSFLQKIFDPEYSIQDVIASPIDEAKGALFAPHCNIGKPQDICAPVKYGKGIDILHINDILLVEKAYNGQNILPIKAYSIIGGKECGDCHFDIISPNNCDKLGQAYGASRSQVDSAVRYAQEGLADWDKISNEGKRQIALKAADIMESRMLDLMYICAIEAGKTISDGVAEIKEAVDFLRYYAHMNDVILDNEHNIGTYAGFSVRYKLVRRGVFLCISPWNFPCAIFIGQVMGALMAGNTVIAKPAEQTPYIAYITIKILMEAGLPKNVVQLVQGSGISICTPALISNRAINGIAFTGSTEVGKILESNIAQRLSGPIPLIAETGGQNAMIVDSTALPEQVTVNVLDGAFKSAGQRCSATRVLFIQSDIYDSCLEMIINATRKLKVGNPIELSTDIGPVINKGALEALDKHVKYLESKGKLIYRHQGIPEDGLFFPPTIFEIDSISDLKREAFGPILHVIKYNIDNIDNIIDSINNTEYSLTFALHTRIINFANSVVNKIKAGNVYINRNQIGALVGINAFGGFRMSGTGFKAGGPNYLLRFVNCIIHNNGLPYFNKDHGASEMAIENTLRHMSKELKFSIEDITNIVENQSMDIDDNPDHFNDVYSVFGKLICQINIHNEISVINNAISFARNSDITISTDTILEDIRSVGDKIKSHSRDMISLLINIHGINILNGYQSVSRSIMYIKRIVEYFETPDERLRINLPGPTGELNTMIMQARGIGAMIIDRTSSMEDIVSGICHSIITGNHLIILARDYQSMILSCTIYNKFIKDSDISFYLSVIYIGANNIDQILFNKLEDSRVDYILYSGCDKAYIHDINVSSARLLPHIGCNVFALQPIGISIHKDTTSSIKDVFTRNYSEKLCCNIIAVKQDQLDAFTEELKLYIDEAPALINSSMPCKKVFNNNDEIKSLGFEVIHERELDLGNAKGVFKFYKVNCLRDLEKIDYIDLSENLFVITYNNKDDFLNSALQKGFSIVNGNSISIVTGGIGDFSTPLSLNSPMLYKRVSVEKMISHDLTSSGGNVELALNS